MLGKVLRILGIVLMAISSIFVLLGGIGTGCIAFNPTGYGPKFGLLEPFQWLYILYVLTGVVFGLAGIVATIRLVKGKSGAYRLSIIILVASLIISVVHVLSSRALRGSSMPADAIMYATALTLVVFLLFRIPGIWNKINFSRRDDHASGLGAGVAMIVVGMIVLTVHIWAGPTHTIDGVNFADAWHWPLTIIGWASLLGGGAILGRYVLDEPELDGVVSPVSISH